MARRKNGMLSDGSDSDASDDAGSDASFNSQEDGDSRAERRLFEHRHKRPRTTGRSGKDAAWEGIFGEEDDGFNSRSRGGLGKRGGKGSSGSRVDWTKAPAFVSSGPSKPAVKEEDTDGSANISRAVSGEPSKASSSDSDASDSDGSDNDATRPPSPRIVNQEDNEEDRRPTNFASVKAMFASSGMAVDRDSKSAEPSPSSAPSPAPVVSAFGKKAAAARQSFANVERSNFQPSRSTTPKPAAPAHTLSNSEKVHFNKISDSFGAKMLSKFGWAPGKGLGVQEDGRAVPVESAKAIRGEGIRSGMRTEDSKREARRRGELVEEEEAPRRGKKPPRQREPRAPQDGWKKQKRVKVKVEHLTYEQLLDQVPDTTRSGVGLVLDARSGEMKTVESLSELSLSSWTPTSDATQLPELRHNLRLILDVAKGEVGNLAREGKKVNERRQWSTREEERAHKRMDTASGTISRLEDIQATVRAISTMSLNESTKTAPSLSGLEDAFNNLISQDEYALLSLDEVVVGSIDQVMRKAFASWHPFDVSSDALLATLKPWRKAFNLPSDGDANSEETSAERTMTAWESLLWHRWLPKVRSVLNNEWDAADPQPAVHLVESWEPILPAFIRDNVIDQLVLPKVRDAVDDWTGRPRRDGRSVSLASIIFPWLPLLGERINDILDEGKRRIRSVLRKWKLTDGPLDELVRWKQDIFSSHEWDKLMGENVLGKLGSCLRDDFVINPRSQDLAPLVKYVLPWHTLIRRSNFVRLFEMEFFPKWLNVLYLWLVHPGYSGDEVARWFEMWKGLFPAELLSSRAIANGFETGLKLMDDALSLGSEAPSKLQRPNYQPVKSSSSASNGKSSTPTPRLPVQKPVHQTDITFRNIAEEYIAANDLIMLPLGKSHAVTGKPLFRVGRTIEGKGGINIYVGEDAVFAQNEEGTYRAVPLDELVKRASA